MNSPAPSLMNTLRHLTVGSVAALALLSLAWELWLAPLRPGGSMLVLKAAPLLLALPPLYRGHVRTYQWWSMLILAYLCEGLVRGASDPGRSAMLGWIEAALSAVAFATILGWTRLARPRGGERRKRA